MRFGLGTRNAEAVITNLRAFDLALRDDAKTIVREHRDQVVARVQELVPYDKGFMHDHVRGEVSPGGYVFEAGWDEADFTAAGLDYYPIFVEFGTSKMAAQPSLFPAMMEDRPLFAADLEQALRDSVARFGGR